METIQREHDKPRGSKPLIRETLWIIKTIKINMSTKIYKHLTSTNYENISEKIKKAQKKSPAHNVHGKSNKPA